MVEGMGEGHKASLLSSLRHLSASKATVSNADFQQLLECQNHEMPLADWREVALFASDQCPQWQTQWLFSPAASPDTRAAEELEGWQKTYTACLEPLIQSAPVLREHLS